MRLTERPPDVEDGGESKGGGAGGGDGAGGKGAEEGGGAQVQPRSVRQGPSEPWWIGQSKTLVSAPWHSGSSDSEKHCDLLRKQCMGASRASCVGKGPERRLPYRCLREMRGEEDGVQSDGRAPGCADRRGRLVGGTGWGGGAGWGGEGWGGAGWGG